VKTLASDIRRFVISEYIEPARQRGSATVQVKCGEVLKGLGLDGSRAAAVCGALNAAKFHGENHIRLESREGPPSGLSTTVKFTFRLADGPTEGASPEKSAAFLSLKGIGKEVFAGLGGGEAFIQKERERFYSAEGEA
jgi:5-methylcytosine-specific restriction protein B